MFHCPSHCHVSVRHVQTGDISDLEPPEVKSRAESASDLPSGQSSPALPKAVAEVRKPFSHRISFPKETHSALAVELRAVLAMYVLYREPIPMQPHSSSKFAPCTTRFQMVPVTPRPWTISLQQSAAALKRCNRARRGQYMRSVHQQTNVSFHT
jgi:hypothetical protein